MKVNEDIYYNSKGAKTHFIISFVIVAVLLLIIPVVTLFLLSNAYDQQIRLESQRITSSIRRTVRTFVDGAYNLSFELSDNPSILSFDPEIQAQILRNCAERNPYMELIYITGMDGMQTARSSGILSESNERWWFSQIMEERLPFVSKSYYSLSTGMPCTAIFIPMHDNSEMVGIFGVDISLEYIQSMVEQYTNIENGQYAFIIDGEGVVIAHHDKFVLETLTNYRTLTRTVPAMDLEGNPLLREDGNIRTIEREIETTDSFKAIILDVMAGNSGLELVDYNDGVYYMSYEPITLPGHSDSWSVITLHDRDVAMSVISRLLTQEILVVVVVLIIFIALIYTLFKSLSKTMDYLENARVEADHANNSKSRFLATMSHEIRTPLNAIIGLTQVQLQHKELPRESLDALEKIYASGNSLLKIINDILDLSKVETGLLELTPEVYETPHLINDTVQLNIVRIGGKDIKFILYVNKSLPSKILGDSLRVKQILTNLLSNAIKYTQEGYVKLMISHFTNGDDIILCCMVEDTGIGLSQEDQQRLFSEYARFNTRDNMFIEGTGLGLTITKKLVEMMGGEINVQSEIGKGSIFTVTLKQKAVECKPIGTDVAKMLQNFTFFDDTHSLLHIEYTNLPDGSVLVVDDVELNLFVAEAVLKPYNLHLEMVTSGITAIEMIKNGKTFDIIFMDHMMPDMDGVETTKKLREMGYTGAIVALTANALVGNEEMFTQSGFDHFISKPIDIHNLDEVISKYIKSKP